MKKIVFLTSTRGTNIKAILKRILDGHIKADPIAIVTDKPEAKALEVAKNFQVPSIVIPYRNYKKTPLDFHDKVHKTLVDLKPDLIVAAGYLRILQAPTVKKFKNRIVNIHPSLLPAFTGLHAPEQAMAYGVRFTGCTTHFVDEGVDTGAIILQACVAIKPGMSEMDLQREIQKEEHRIFPLTVQYFCEGRIKIIGRKTIIV
ncbi:MAG: phosphoribosylglycinamide formyltransferase [Spirochaetota bacterium]